MKIFFYKFRIMTVLVVMLSTMFCTFFVGSNTLLADTTSKKHIYLKKNDNNSAKKLKMNLGDSVVLHLPESAREVLVADPEKVSVVMRSPRLAYLISKKIGKTDVFFFSKGGRQITTFTADVSINVIEIQRMIDRVIGGGKVRISLINDKVILSGYVSDPSSAKHAVDIASAIVSSKDAVINTLSVRKRMQVLLRVTIAEIQRDILRNLGINLSSSLSIGSRILKLSSPNSITQAAGFAASGTFGLGGKSSISGSLSALERNNMARTLAEPNLTAMSGEKADFLAGGEYPVPVSQGGDISIEYKPYGVSLSFVPTVLDKNRINLAISTAVSELSQANSVQIGGVSVPSLTKRKADTTVEMSSGSSLVIAGLINEKTMEGMSGVPGIMDIPILGALFRSKNFTRSQTELAVIVTPYIVQPTSPNTLSRPDEGYKPPDNTQSFILGTIGNVYGGGGVPEGEYLNGNYGFID